MSWNELVSLLTNGSTAAAIAIPTAAVILAALFVFASLKLSAAGVSFDLAIARVFKLSVRHPAAEPASVSEPQPAAAETLHGLAAQREIMSARPVGVITTAPEAHGRAAPVPVAEPDAPR